MKYLVIADPKVLPNHTGLNPGTMLHRSQSRQHELAGVVLMPVEEYGVPVNSCVVTYYGSGAKLADDQTTRLAPMYLEMIGGKSVAHWLVGVEADGPNPRGSFGLATAACPLPSPSLSNFAPPSRAIDAGLASGFLEVVGGTCDIVTPGPCVIGLQIRMMGSNLRVLWAAISLCEERNDAAWLG